ncbi:MAG: MFS transporter [Chloroflexia bacterium]|nr:MFS transporter [Chloroflexia bacterium]
MFSILRNRDFGLLWLAGLVSYAGDFALIVALPLHVYSLTGSATATAAAFAASFLPGVLFGSIAGVFVDRWDRKRTMVVTHLLRAIILLPLLLAPNSLGLLYAVAAAQGANGLFFSPAESALLPTLVGKDRLVAANAMNALNDNFGRLIGPAVGALLYSRTGIAGVALVDAATYVGSALLIGLIATDARPARDEDTVIDGSPLKRMVSDWRAGLRVVRDDRSLSVLFATSSLGNVAEGVFLTLGLAPLVLDVLGGTPAQVGWLGTAQAVGGLIAGVSLVRIGQRLTMRWLVGGGLVGLGLADFAAFNAHRLAAPGTPAVAVAMGWMGLAGFPVVAGGAGRQALVQTRAPDAYRGRVFGALSAVRGVAMLIGLGVGGVLGDAIGIVPVLSASAVLRALAGVLALTLLPRNESTPGGSDPLAREAPTVGPTEAAKRKG